MRDTTIPTIVESSSKYLEQKEIFRDFSEALNLDDYSDDFKDFDRGGKLSFFNETACLSFPVSSIKKTFIVIHAWRR